MTIRHPSARPIPAIWVLSDARNDAALDRVLRRLPSGCGVVLRHYHLPAPERAARIAKLARIARGQGHWLVLAGSVAEARKAGADGAYGTARKLAHGGRTLRLLTAHSLGEIGAASRARADAVVLSPVWPTASHPGGKGLGRVRFRLLAARSPVPVIALGGMSGPRARALQWPRWAAIDAFSR